MHQVKSAPPSLLVKLRECLLGTERKGRVRVGGEEYGKEKGQGLKEGGGRREGEGRRKGQRRRNRR